MFYLLISTSFKRLYKIVSWRLLFSNVCSITSKRVLLLLITVVCLIAASDTRTLLYSFDVDGRGSWDGSLGGSLSSSLNIIRMVCFSLSIPSGTNCSSSFCNIATIFLVNKNFTLYTDSLTMTKPSLTTISDWVILTIWVEFRLQKKCCKVRVFN